MPLNVSLPAASVYGKLRVTFSEKIISPTESKLTLAAPDTMQVLQFNSQLTYLLRTHKIILFRFSLGLWLLLASLDKADVIAELDSGEAVIKLSGSMLSGITRSLGKCTSRSSRNSVLNAASSPRIA